MIIKEINFLNQSNGLKEIKIRNLQKIVIIAGINGSGKTRLLHLIKAKVHDVLNQVQIDKLINENKILNYEIENLKNELSKIDKNDINKCSGIHDIINDKKEKIKLNNSILDRNELVPYYRNFESLSAFFLTPPTDGLKDYKDLKQNDIKNLSDKVRRKIGLEDSEESTLAYIYDVQKDYIYAKNNENDENIKSYLRLKEIIKEFLGCDLTYDKNGDCSIFGFPIGKAYLSAGQRILLKFCVMLHAQGDKLNNFILLLDEPENFLHPSIVLKVINNIVKMSKNCQIFIATHSLNTISYYFNEATLIYMEDSKAEFTGEKPEKIIKGLLGEENGIQKLSNFMDLPIRLGIINFIIQSILEPKIIGYKKNDSQQNQIYKTIINNFKDKKINILDYGAGEGRILIELYEKNINHFKNKFDYYAYDKVENLSCVNNINLIYQNNKKRYFIENKDKFPADLYFDLIVMCNVLHEIDPVKWIDIFNKESEIMKSLSDKGFLLIAEVKEISKGEKAHQFNFFVLDKEELSILFKTSINDIISNPVKNERLTSYLIQKKHLINIDKISIKKTIEMLQKKSVKEINKITSSGNTSYSNGLKFAFWTLQHSNSTLYLNKNNT